MEHPYVYEMNADRKNYFNLFYYNITPQTPKRDDMVHCHMSLEFVYVKEGTFPVHIHGDSRVLKTGEIACVHSGQIHYYTTLGNAQVYVAIVSLEYLDDPIHQGKCMLPSFISLSAPEAENMNRLFALTHDILDPDNPSLAKGFFSTFYGLLSGYRISEERPKQDSFFPIFEILKYIEDHFTENITLKHLAAHFNYKDTYFSSCFNVYMNMSLREYINRVRIGHVVVFMQQGMSKNDAAAASGYTNVRTFYRAYNKYHANLIKDLPPNPNCFPNTAR